ncbi:MAG: thiamine-phosphate kinase [Halobacteriota archaeon]
MTEVHSEWSALAEIAEAVDAADDAAVLPRGSENLVLTTDMLHESTDLPSGVTDYTAGWRVAAVSLSDVAAMAAEALAVVAACGVPEFTDRWLSEFVSGAVDVCDAVDAEYVGGDLDSHDEPTYVSSALGATSKPVYRDGASPGDVVCFTGELCRTAVALDLFESGRDDEANRLFRFEPRVREGVALSGVASCLTDVSDGVAVSLHQVAEASDVGFRVRRDELPLHHEAETDDVYVGGDYELLFTLPPDSVDGVEFEFSVVGDVVESREPAVEIDGEEMPKRGYSH